MITLCCPTHKRPKQMRRLYESIIDTAWHFEDIELVFYIDNNDIESKEEFKNIIRERIIHDQDIPYIKFIDGPKIVLADMWNKCQQAGQGPIYMVCADDIVFSSEDWDKLIIDKFEEYPDKIALIYGRDGGKNESLATHPFLHQNWIDTVGYFTPPYFEFCMCDKWLDYVAQKIGRRVFIKEVYTAHWHCENRKFCPSGQPDQTRREMQARGAKQDFRGLYHKKGKERDEDAEKLLRFIEKFKNENNTN